MDFQTFKKEVVSCCAAMGIEEYELYYTSGESISVDAYQHEINAFTASKDGGVCFRCIVDGKMGYASTEDLSEEQARSVVEQAVDNAKCLEAEEQVFLGQGGQDYEMPQCPGYPMPSAEALIAAVLDTQEKLYAADQRIIDGCQTEGFAQSSELAIVNSKGLDLHYENRCSGLVAVAVVSDGQEMSNDFQFKLGQLETIDTDALTKKAAAEALRKMGGEPAPTGNYPVVFSPDAMASLLAAFSSVFSSEAAQKGLSKFAGQEGQTVAAETVTILDDPFHPDSPMPMPFDAEGSPTRCKTVVGGGQLQTLLYNLKTAAVAGTKTTGNASKAGYDAPVMIRPFTLYLQGGNVSEEALLQQAENGVFIDSLSGLHAGADPVSGDFSLQSAGFLIENGTRTKPVKSFTVAGNFYELLRNVSAVADNCSLHNAMGITNFGAPSTLVMGLSVAGK